MNDYGRIFNSSLSSVSICLPSVEPILIGTEYFDYTYPDSDDPHFDMSSMQPSIQSYGNNIFTLSNPYRRVPLYYYEPNPALNNTSFQTSMTLMPQNIQSGSAGSKDIATNQVNSFSSLNQFYEGYSQSKSQTHYQNHRSLSQYNHEPTQAHYLENTQILSNKSQANFDANKANHQLATNQQQYQSKNQFTIGYPYSIQSSKSQQPLQQASLQWEVAQPVENQIMNQNLVSTVVSRYSPVKVSSKVFSAQNVLVDNGPQPVVQPALNALIKPSTKNDFYYTDKYHKKSKKSKTRRPGNPEVIAEFIEVLDKNSPLQEFNVMEEKSCIKPVSSVPKDSKRIAYRYCDYYDSNDCYQVSSYKNYPVKTRYFDYTKNDYRDYDSGFETYDKYSI